MTRRVPHLLPGAAGAPLPEGVSMQAVRWLVALESPDVDERTRRQWRQWRASHPDHERAWRLLEEAGLSLRSLPAAALRAALADEAGRLGRRRALKALGLSGLVGAGAWMARGSEPWRDWTADHRTATGERSRLALADGSQVLLNTDSAIDVRFDDRQRRIVLLRGEILVTSAPDPQADGAASRPLLVDTAEGRLRALGTRFAVRQEEGESLLGVFDGAVEIRPAGAPGDARVVQAGMRSAYTRFWSDAPRPVEPADGAWIDGLIVAHRMPLARFAAELSRYRPGHLGCDPEVAWLPVSGVYPVHDTDRVLEMLARLLPVKVRRRTRYWVDLAAAGA